MANVVTEQPQTQIGCAASVVTTVYAFVACDANSDGVIDDYIQVAQHQWQTYPEIQEPTIDANGNCVYSIEPICSGEILSIDSVTVVAGFAGSIDIGVVSGIVDNPCPTQSFTLNYDCPTDTMIAVQTIDQKVLHIFPNPATATITFEYDLLEDEEVLLLYNSLGQLVKEVELHPSSSSKTISVNAFVEGVYYWQLGNRSGKLSVY